jgi:hypothetical protein
MGESGVVEKHAMPRFLLNPTFDIETGKLLSHDGESFEEPGILFDRNIQSQATNSKKQADTTAGQFGSNATGEGDTLRSTLTSEALHPTGFAPTDLNNMLVAQQEGAGGANATVTGEGKLAALRQRNAGGFAPALAEAQRVKGRTLATGGLDVANENARLKQQQQQQGLAGLQGLYGTDTSNQLRAMGLSAEDLQNELAAGRQGWLQNTEGVLQSLGDLGQGVGKVMHG